MTSDSAAIEAQFNESFGHLKGSSLVSTRKPTHVNGSVRSSGSDQTSNH